MLAAALPLTLAYAAARRRRRYSEPRLLRIARPAAAVAASGEEPIESLASIGGGRLAPLAAICQDLLAIDVMSSFAPASLKWKSASASRPEPKRWNAQSAR